MLRMWEERADFKQATETACAMKVNGHAECGVPLTQEFSGLLSRNKPQFKFLLQVVDEQCHTYPDCRTLAGYTGQ